jgi:hypothetical protein
MNRADASAVVAAVLYEGYILYPYRPSSVKNQQRWTFGGVFPTAFAHADGGDPCAMQTQCLVRGDARTRVELCVGFLHLVAREIGSLTQAIDVLPATEVLQFTPVASLDVAGERYSSWEEAVEREIMVPATTIEALLQGVAVSFAFPGSRSVEAIRDAAGDIVAVAVRTALEMQGQVSLSAIAVGPGTFRLTARIENTTPLSATDIVCRELAQRHSFVSSHMLLGVEGGVFVSLTDPPEDLREAARRCENQGVWPVLVGAPGAVDTMLSSPIILYDYPEIAPESTGDLFDATEIDEILILRILTMTDEEKREMAAVDSRLRAMLERTEGLTPAALDRLHGTLRYPHASTTPVVREVGGSALKVGTLVRLRPKPGGDIFDIVLKDQIAVVEAIECDFENREHVAVTLLDDPGRDMGMQRMPGHRFFFAPSEMEVLDRGAGR